MTAVSPKQLALLQAQLNAARLSAIETHKSVSKGSARNAQMLLPFLDSCAQELEQTAQMIRAAADQAATTTPRGCAG